MNEDRGALQREEVRLVASSAKDAVLAEIDQNRRTNEQELKLRMKHERSARRVEKTFMRINTLNKWAVHLPLHRALSADEIKALSPYATRWHLAEFAKGVVQGVAGIGLWTVPVTVLWFLAATIHFSFGIGAGLLSVAEFILFMLWTMSHGGHCRFFERFFTRVIGRKVINSLSYLLRGHYCGVSDYHSSYTEGDQKALAEFFYGPET